MPAITGTENSETLTGSVDADTIDGLGGDDIIYGLGGDDILDGGAGHDVLYGGDGNDLLRGGNGLDQFYGGEGDDRLVVNIYNAGGTVLLHGGSGNDLIEVGFPFGPLVSNWGVNLSAGDGDDSVLLTNGTGNIVDLDAGNDRVLVTGSRSTITLGAGSDEVALAFEFGPNRFGYSGQTILTDYQPGVDSVTVDWHDQFFFGWSGANSPFAEGFLRVVQDGADAVLQRNYGAVGNFWVDILRFENVEMSSLTAADLGGYHWDGSPATGVVLTGTEGDDEITVDLTGRIDGLVGGAGADTISGLGGADQIQGGAGNDLIYGGDGADLIFPGLGSDAVYGGAGDDTLSDFGGSDHLYGEDGNDLITLQTALGDVALLDGGAGDDLIMVLRDTVVASAGSVAVEGGLDNDTVFVRDVSLGAVNVNLGAGNDTYHVAGAGAATVTFGDGADILQFSYYLGAAGSGPAATITDYQAGIDSVLFDYSTLQGWDGATNPFSSGYLRLVQQGADVMLQADQNGGGDAFVDLARFQNISVAAFSAGDFGGFRPDGRNPGIVQSGTEAADVLAGGERDDELYGLGGNDHLSGLAGSDVLNGGAGSDTTDGGAGNDVHFVDSASDVVVERINEGSDTVLSWVNYTLGSGVHVETLAAADAGSTAPLMLFGNEHSQTIVGNAGANLLLGGGGADVLAGLAGNDDYLVDSDDIIFEAASSGYDSAYALSSYALAADAQVELLLAHDQAGTEALTLVGNRYGQTILGNAGNNLLIGGGGSDALVGFGGNDDYLVTGANEYAAESENGGYDSVYTQGSYTLGYYSHIELLLAHNQAGTESLALIGNQYGNTILGNAGANFIAGGGGSDVLVGFGGNDDYLVTGMNEYVAEDQNGGFDSVYTQGSYTLGYYSQIELLTAHNQAGTESMALIGNQYNNMVIGNAGANFIVGGGGTDTLIGLGGDDDYLVESYSETVSEAAGGGVDSVYTVGNYTLNAGSAVERLIAHDQASTKLMVLVGNEYGNLIIGNAGDTIIDGRGGADTLIGGSGYDAFAFSTALGNGNIDTIADFDVQKDAFILNPAIFANVGEGPLNQAAFHQGTAAADGDDRIIYDQATGAVFYDADGSGAGAAIQFATVTAGLQLTAANFTTYSITYFGGAALAAAADSGKEAAIASSLEGESGQLDAHDFAAVFADADTDIHGFDHSPGDAFITASGASEWGEAHSLSWPINEGFVPTLSFLA